MNWGVAVMRSEVINGGEAIVLKLGSPIVKYLGVSGSLVSIIFIVAAFIFWQVRTNGKWRIQPPVLVTMFFESLFFAIVLFIILGMFAHYVAEDPRTPPRRRASVRDEIPRAAPAMDTRGPVACAKPVRRRNRSARLHPVLRGRGVYEELVFRVLLLGLLMLVLTRLLHMEHAYAAAWSVALGAFIFSAFHHLGENGDKFEVKRVFCSA